MISGNQLHMFDEILHFVIADDTFNQLVYRTMRSFTSGIGMRDDNAS